LIKAKNRALVSARRTLLFIDRIHSFNKPQQDVLLPEMEQKVVISVGATVENRFLSSTTRC